MREYMYLGVVGYMPFGCRILQHNLPLNVFGIKYLSSQSDLKIPLPVLKTRKKHLTVTYGDHREYVDGNSGHETEYNLLFLTHY